MRIKRFSGALAISVACHIVVVIIAGFHLVPQDRQFKELLGAEFVLFSEAPKPKVRKAVIESVIKSTAPLQNPNTPNTPTANVMFERPPGLAMVQQVGVGRNQVAENRMLHSVKVPKQHPQILQPPNGAAYDDVFFKGAGTNPFIDTEDDAFSTFGMDVDTASYAVMRRYLRDGYLPPSEAVRVEEFVNAFDYNYTPPADEAFAVHLEGAPSKFGEGKRFNCCESASKGALFLTLTERMRYLPS